MAEQRHEDEAIHGQGRALRRRGLIAGAAALVAGIAAKRAAEPVVATSGLGDQGFLALGSNDWYIAASANPNQAAVSSAPTVIQASPNFINYAGTNGGHRTVFEVDARPTTGDITGIVSWGSAHGPGLVGNGETGGAGVYGRCIGGPGSYGVWGVTDLGRAVVGEAASDGTGVFGTSDSGAGNGNGVHGIVYHVGQSQVTAGVFGDSDVSYGVIGRTTALNYSGCTGVANGAGRAAFAGAGTNGAYGAYFTGPTVVNGNFTVVGGQKNAAVKHTDGSYRLLHCVESPEPWFEDFGEAKLVNGHADVKIDPDFAAVVDTSAYHVFLTTHGDFHIHTTQRGAAGFAVQQTTGTGSAGASGSFSYRIVAKRKDINPGRMAKFELPKIRLPKPEEMPPPPTPPKKRP